MKYIFFDLDGTLSDPQEGIFNSLKYAFDKLGMTLPDDTELRRFIGPPLLDSFRKYYQFPLKKAQFAVAAYREYFSQKGLFENRLYPGIDKLLAELSDYAHLALVSSKPQEFVFQILKHFAIDQYFTMIRCATLDDKISRKTDVIRFALTLCPNKETKNILMVGDHELDILGARDNGISAGAVLYGYGDKDKLISAKPVFTADSVNALHDELLKWINNPTQK